MAFLRNMSGKQALWLLGAAGLAVGLIFANDAQRVGLITLAALIMFAAEALPVSVTALSVMASLMALGLVDPREGVSGFSNPATITVLAMFGLSAGIRQTGALNALSAWVFRFAGGNRFKQILALTLLVAPASGFINNTAAVAIMLPLTLELAKRAKTPSTRLLIPLSYLSMAGGMLTLVGTSTNLLASSALEDLGMPAIGMFDFSALGLVALMTTALYLTTVGRWLLPDRDGPEAAPARHGVDGPFLTEVRVQRDSRLIGAPLEAGDFLDTFHATAVRLSRNGKTFRKQATKKPLQEGDVLTLRAPEQSVIRLEQDERYGVRLLYDFDPGGRRPSPNATHLVRALARTPRAFRRRMAALSLRERYGVRLAGVQRAHGDAPRLSDLTIEPGDILLLKASTTALRRLERAPELLTLDTFEKAFVKPKAWPAFAILAGVIVTAAVGALPIMTAALVGLLLMVFSGCLEPEDLHQSVEWEVIFLLAGVIPLAIAMEKSGAVALAADALVGVAGFLPPLALLICFYVITTLLTEIVSNNASIVILTPVAVAVAAKLGLNPMAFVFATMFAASTSFLTPIGYQTNTMVYAAGNYRFSDFFKVGAPLNALLAVVTPIGIALIWGLKS